MTEATTAYITMHIFANLTAENLEKGVNGVLKGRVGMEHTVSDRCGMAEQSEFLCAPRCIVPTDASRMKATSVCQGPRSRDLRRCMPTVEYDRSLMTAARRTEQQRVGGSTRLDATSLERLHWLLDM